MKNKEYPVRNVEKAFNYMLNRYEHNKGLTVSIPVKLVNGKKTLGYQYFSQFPNRLGTEAFVTKINGKGYINFVAYAKEFIGNDC